jgi:hypothetical protein
MSSKQDIHRAKGFIEHVRHRDNYWRVSRKQQDELLDYAIQVLKELEEAQ